ncbi:iron chaperone [Mycetocola miduiensis]|uniref:Uncharacterized conserved protein YdhG, YjbR/CyaY-like superfamily, DUF1801 family n=1 Tax=Mycetocola miduiensis TaxID=995034 RepID=A0A1I4YZ49_9MICO|nr:DUF1801 domain-containing protein [Mycetocola miduiensis]SFN42930.1 Uncharacterized conserved protein YdhG, YjbR/CyaY-like superfamily, DUF1801 family [Mycetocola miduiensis]
MDETTGGKKYDGFSDEERDAMKERAKELKAEARRGEKETKVREKGEADLRAKIAEMPESDRAIAERLHAMITEVAPDLMPKTWYGQPAWARDGEVVCFFQSSAKFKTRYSTFGFSETANLDEGSMWETSFALTQLSDEDENRLAALVKKAVR